MDQHEQSSDIRVNNLRDPPRSAMVNPNGDANGLLLDAREQEVELSQGGHNRLSAQDDNIDKAGDVTRDIGDIDNVLDVSHDKLLDAQQDRKDGDEGFCDWIDGVFSDDESIGGDSMDVDTEPETRSAAEPADKPLKKQPWEGKIIHPVIGYGRRPVEWTSFELEELEMDIARGKALKQHKASLKAGQQQPQVEPDKCLFLQKLSEEDDSRTNRCVRKLVMLESPPLLQKLQEMNHKTRQTNDRNVFLWEQLLRRRAINLQQQRLRITAQKTPPDGSQKQSSRPVKLVPAVNFVTRDINGQTGISGRRFNDQDPTVTAQDLLRERMPTIADFSSLAERIEKNVEHNEIFVLHEQWRDVLQYVEQSQPYFFGFDYPDNDTLVVFTANSRTLELRFLRVEWNDIHKFSALQKIRERTSVQDISRVPQLIKKQSYGSHRLDVDFSKLAITKIREAREGPQIIPEMFKVDGLFPEDAEFEDCTFCLFDCDYGVYDDRFWLRPDAVTKYCSTCHTSTWENFEEPYRVILKETRVNYYDSPSFEELSGDIYVEQRALLINRDEAYRYLNMNQDRENLAPLKEFIARENVVKEVLLREALKTSAGSQEHRAMDYDGMDLDSAAMSSPLPSDLVVKGRPGLNVESSRAQDHTSGSRQIQILQSQNGGHPSGSHLHLSEEQYEKRKQQLREQAMNTNLRTGLGQKQNRTSVEGAQQVLTQQALLNGHVYVAQEPAREPSNTGDKAIGNGSVHLRGGAGNMDLFDESTANGTRPKAASQTGDTAKTLQRQQSVSKAPKPNGQSKPVTPIQIQLPSNKGSGKQRPPAPTIKYEAKTPVKTPIKIPGKIKVKEGVKSVAKLDDKKSETPRPVSSKQSSGAMTGHSVNPKAAQGDGVASTPTPSRRQAGNSVATKPNVSQNHQVKTPLDKQLSVKKFTRWDKARAIQEGNIASSSTPSRQAAGSSVAINPGAIQPDTTSSLEAQALRPTLKRGTPYLSDGPPNKKAKITVTEETPPSERRMIIPPGFIVPAPPGSGGLTREQVNQATAILGSNGLGENQELFDIALTPDRKKKLLINMENYRKCFGDAYERQQAQFRTEGRRVIAPLWTGEMFSSLNRSRKLVTSARQTTSGSPSVQRPHNTADPQPEGFLPNTSSPSPAANPRRSGSGKASSSPVGRRQSGEQVSASPRVTKLSASQTQSTSPRLPALPASPRSPSLSLPRLENSGLSKAPPLSLRYANPANEFMSEQGSLEALGAMKKDIHTVLDSPIACISSHSSLHNTALEKGVTMAEIAHAVPLDIWIDPSETGSSPETQGRRASLGPSMGIFKLPKSGAPPVARRIATPKAPIVAPAVSSSNKKRALSSTPVQCHQPASVHKIDPRAAHLQVPHNPKNPSGLRNVVVVPPSPILPTHTPSPVLPTQVSPHAEFMGHLPRGTKHSPPPKSFSQKSHSDNLPNPPPTAEQIKKASGILLCRGSPYGQVDTTKARICKKCFATKSAIIMHRHDEFISLDELGNKDFGYYETDDLKTNVTGRKLRACMICPGRAQWVCNNCPLRVCEGCKTNLVELCKGKVENLMMHLDREHVRNDAFLLRADGGGY